MLAARASLPEKSQRLSCIKPLSLLNVRSVPHGKPIRICRQGTAFQASHTGPKACFQPRPWPCHRLSQLALADQVPDQQEQLHGRWCSMQAGRQADTMQQQSQDEAFSSRKHNGIMHLCWPDSVIAWHAHLVCDATNDAEMMSVTFDSACARS